MKILLVIDIQDRYLKDYDPGLVDRINLGIRQAQDEAIPIFYVRNIPRSGSDEDYGYAGSLLMVSSYRYDKIRPSAFSNPAFAEDLKRLGVTEIEMAGVDGNCCVRKTCLDAVAAGFKVSLCLDRIGARNKKIYEKTLKELLEVTGQKHIASNQIM